MGISNCFLIVFEGHSMIWNSSMNDTVKVAKRRVAMDGGENITPPSVKGTLQ